MFSDHGVAGWIYFPAYDILSNDRANVHWRAFLPLLNTEKIYDSCSFSNRGSLDTEAVLLLMPHLFDLFISITFSWKSWIGSQVYENGWLLPSLSKGVVTVGIWTRYPLLGAGLLRHTWRSLQPLTWAHSQISWVLDPSFSLSLEGSYRSPRMDTSERGRSITMEGEKP